MPAHLLVNAKAYAALIGSVCTALLGIFSTGQVGHILTVVVAVTTAVATWRVPNVPTAATSRDEAGNIDPGSAALGMIFGALIVWLVLR